jgi:hypothetical protein
VHHYLRLPTPLIAPAYTIICACRHHYLRLLTFKKKKKENIPPRIFAPADTFFKKKKTPL